jgi:hypothetical protein
VGIISTIEMDSKKKMYNKYDSKWTNEDEVREKVKKRMRKTKVELKEHDNNVHQE